MPSIASRAACHHRLAAMGICMLLLPGMRAFSAVPETADAAVAERNPPGSIAGAMEPRPLPGIQPVVRSPQSPPDPCSLSEVTSQPARPVWTGGAQTVQCGVMENDLGWRWQSLGAGISQQMLPMNLRYGLTPRLELDWALPTRMVQAGDGMHLTGITDQSLGAMYRFAEQGRWRPAMAVSYGLKIPTANPAKGFGTGYTDHQMVLLASRDVRKVHFDFNTVGVLAGGPLGHDGAVQYGLVLSVPVRANLAWLLETDGGSQPGIPDRFGQALTGASWALRPWLVLDAAWTRAYTAGSPRQQFTMGVTYAHRPRSPLPTASRLLRLLGR